MSTYRLDKLFSPRSVAVVGASPRATSPGRAVLRNLRAAAFEGSIALVNPRYGEIEGIKAVKTIQDLPTPPDLLVIAAPPQLGPRHRESGRRKRCGGRDHHHRRPRPRSRLACRCLREGGASDRPQAGRPQLPRRVVVARQAQCQFCGAHAAHRRSRSGVAVRRHHRGPDRMVGGARYRLFGRGLAWRHDRCRCRRPARFLRARWRDPCDSPVRRIDQQRAQSSCRRRARPPGSSRSWWSSRAAMRRPRRPRRRTPARSPVRMRSTTRRSVAPACCGCSTSTNCSPPPRHSGGCGRSWASGSRSSRMAGASASWPSTGSSTSAARSPAFRRKPC